MKNNYVDMVIGGVWVLVVGVLLGIVITKHVYRQEAIDRGFAIYNPTNGIWQWKEPEQVKWENMKK